MWSKSPGRRISRCWRVPTYTELGAGEYNTCGITTAGLVQCWGHNNAGESTPPAGIFSAIAAGDDFTCGMRPGGTVTCWGANAYGQASPPAGVTFATGGATNAPAPTCGVTGLNPGPPATQQVTGRAAGGLAAIYGIAQSNGTNIIAPFLGGTTGWVVLTETKVSQTQKTVWSFYAEDDAGKITYCH